MDEGGKECNANNVVGVSRTRQDTGPRKSTKAFTTEAWNSVIEENRALAFILRDYGRCSRTIVTYLVPVTRDAVLRDLSCLGHHFSTIVLTEQPHKTHPNVNYEHR